MRTKAKLFVKWLQEAEEESSDEEEEEEALEVLVAAVVDYCYFSFVITFIVICCYSCTYGLRVSW